MSLFKESESYRPFKYEYLMDASKLQGIELYWDVHSLDLQDDLRQYNTVGGLATPTRTHEQNKRQIDLSIQSFTEMDRTVASGYKDLLQYFKNNEAITWCFSAGQKETVHQRGYATLAETIGYSNSDWTAFSEYKEIRDKLDVLATRAMTGRNEFKAAILLSTILLGEGIGLFAAFSSLLNFKRFGKIIGFNQVNQWSLLDESEHVKTNIKLLSDICKELTEKEIKDLRKHILKTVEIYKQAEYRYIELLGDSEDLTQHQQKDFIEWLCDVRLNELGMLETWNVRPNPLEWMDWLLSGKKHDSFFETRVTDYSHGHLEGNVDYSIYQ